MNRKSVLGIMVMAASLVSAQAVYAAPIASTYTPVNALSQQGKTVKFTLRNDSKLPLKVKVGDSEMTLAPGKPLDVRFFVGSQIVNVETTATNQAGVVLATVMPEMGGATIAVR